jgi:hypothetical protein
VCSGGYGREFEDLIWDREKSNVANGVDIGRNDEVFILKV